MERTPMTYFLEVCRTGSLSKAGKRLGVTPQAVAKAIAQLERELGYTLLERSLEGSKPTELGREVLKIGERMARFQTSAMEQMRSLKETAVECSTINLGLYRGFLQNMPVSMITDFLQLYPEISINIHSFTQYGECEAALCAGKVDLGFGLHTYNEQMLEPLYTYHSEVYAIVGRNHRFAHRESIALEELCGENLILEKTWEDDGYMSAQAGNILSADGESFSKKLIRLGISPRVVLPHLNEATKRQMVMDHGYVALNFSPRAWLPYGITAIALQDIHYKGESDFMKARNRTVTPAVQKYIDFIIPRFETQIG